MTEIIKMSFCVDYTHPDEFNICDLCKGPLIETCSNCTDKPLQAQCKAIQGTCGHYYHYDCIVQARKMTRRDFNCSLCRNKKWTAKRRTKSKSNDLSMDSNNIVKICPDYYDPLLFLSKYSAHETEILSLLSEEPVENTVEETIDDKKVEPIEIIKPVVNKPIKKSVKKPIDDEEEAIKSSVEETTEPVTPINSPEVSSNNIEVINEGSLVTIKDDTLVIIDEDDVTDEMREEASQTLQTRTEPNIPTFIIDDNNDDENIEYDEDGNIIEYVYEEYYQDENGQLIKCDEYEEEEEDDEEYVEDDDEEDVEEDVDEEDVEEEEEEDVDVEEDDEEDDDVKKMLTLRKMLMVRRRR